MITLKNIDEINSMHVLIKKSATGKPMLFAKKLGISERKLYNLLNKLKKLGAPIRYDKDIKTYYYSKPFEIIITNQIEMQIDGQKSVLMLLQN